MHTRRAVGHTATGPPTAKPPFEAVVAEHGTTVLRVCRVLLAQHDAEDAWAETFLAAMRAYPELPADANVQAWLVTIARRKSIDLLRVAKRSAVPVATVPDRAAPIASPDEGDPDLWTAVGRLPDKQRQSIAYRYAAGMSYAQIADILGGSVDAARRAAADGLKTLRKQYRDTNATDVADPTAAGPTATIDPKGALR